MFILFTTLPPVYSQDDLAAEEEIQSITEERRDILRYGIDSQVIGVLEKLEEEKIETLVTEAEELFRSTLNSKVKLAVLSYFSSIDYSGAFEMVLEFLENSTLDELPNDLIAASVRYIADSAGDSIKNAVDLLMELSRHDDALVAGAAVEALGNCRDDECIDFLMELYNDGETSATLRGSILTSLGKMGARKAVPMMEDIVEDIDEERSLRWKACEALGNIGDKKSLPVLRSALGSDDSYLRSYAVGALKSFEGAEVEELLMEALKDSFWKVRVSAAETLGARKAEDAVPILEFKAEKDPEEPVRLAALQALGNIGSPEALEFIRSMLTGYRSSVSLRAESARILLEQDLDGSLEAIEKTLSEAWDNSQQQALLNTIGKHLSLQEHKALKPLFEKMLDHPEIPMRLYAIRGIARNNFSSLTPRLEELSEEGNPAIVRKEALAALENM